MEEEEDPIVEETKRKQKNLKNSSFVEIVIDTESGEVGEFATTENGKLTFAPNKEKRVYVQEISSQSDS